MVRKAKFLTSFLLVVFMLPKVYQDFHILKHHALTISVHAHPKNIPRVLEPKGQNCIICNFEFALSNIPVPFYHCVFIGLIFTLFIRQVMHASQNFTGYFFSLRAPPAFR